MSKNEAETRYELIDPILRDKGYRHPCIKLETPAHDEILRRLNRGIRQIRGKELERLSLRAFAYSAYSAVATLACLRICMGTHAPRVVCSVPSRRLDAVVGLLLNNGRAWIPKSR